MEIPGQSGVSHFQVHIGYRILGYRQRKDTRESPRFLENTGIFLYSGPLGCGFLIRRSRVRVTPGSFFQLLVIQFVMGLSLRRGKPG